VSGRQKFGIHLSQSVQSIRRIENDKIKAAIAIVEGANSNEEGSAQRKKRMEEIRSF
jgi:hypothetical protein